MVAPIAITIIAAALVYGGYTDYKTRTIPNSVPAIIIIAGCFTSTPWPYKLVSLGIFLFAYVVATRITKAKSGGGDLKTYIALSFSVGIIAYFVVAIGTSAIFSIVNTVRRIKHGKRERFPIGTFIAPAFIALVWLPSILGVFI